MSKAVLVIDMPICCNECPICASYAESAFSPREYWCTVSDNTDVDPYDKPKWCPLKEMPLKDERVVDVWNSCIDEILNKD